MLEPVEAKDIVGLLRAMNGDESDASRQPTKHYGVLIGEAVIFAARKFTSIAFLWYNVIGTLVVVGVGLMWPREAARKIRG